MVTPNGEILQTDVVALQTAVSSIRGITTNIILGFDKIDKTELLKELKNIEEICRKGLFAAKYEKDELL